MFEGKLIVSSMQAIQHLFTIVSKEENDKNNLDEFYRENDKMRRNINFDVRLQCVSFRYYTNNVENAFPKKN